MKRIIIISFIIFACAISYGQNKKFDKILEKHDIREYIQDIPIGDTKSFWDTLWRTNEPLAMLIKANEKRSEAYIAASKEMYDASVYSQPYYSSLNRYDAGYITDTLLVYTGVKQVYPDCTIDIIEDSEANAFCSPDGSVFLTDALVDELNANFTQLMGICAHEMSHFFLMHAFVSSYQTQRKYQINSAIGAATSAVVVAANAYAQANGATTSESWDSVNQTINNLSIAAYDDAFERFRYKYNREQEYEADIIAYRFLEWYGVDPTLYIEALETIALEDDKYYDIDSDHPKCSDRIALLRYMGDKYPLYPDLSGL